MGELRRSDDYYRQKEFIKSFPAGELPVQKEIRERLGDQLAEVFFESCIPAMRPLLGVTPLLEGVRPDQDLWISPSDLLIGIVKLKPPLTCKHIQALTHKGILEIGEVIEQKFENEYEQAKQKALIDHENLLNFISEREKRLAVQQARKEEREHCEEVCTELKETFKEQLRRELAELEARLELEKEEAVAEGKRETEEIMQEKLELAVQETVIRLTEAYAIQLMKHSLKLHQHFWFHLKEEKKKLKRALNEVKIECKERLQKLKYEMQCENIANIMFVLANERRRCVCEKQQLEQNFFARLLELQKELEEKEELLKKLTEENDTHEREIAARTQGLFAIIKQFQKFIYFVLRAVPTQAEYLLNIEKLMIFELTKAVMETKPELFANNPLMLKQKTGFSSSSSSSKTEIPDIVVPDAHNCDNTVRVDSSAHTLSSDADLPAFVLGENIYVREDFRNMVSQGIEISKSNELWNHHIESLTELIKPKKSDNAILLRDEIERDELRKERRESDDADKKRERKKSDREKENEIKKKKRSGELHQSACSVRFSLLNPKIIVPISPSASSPSDSEKVLHSLAYDTPKKSYEDLHDNNIKTQKIPEPRSSTASLEFNFRCRTPRNSEISLQKGITSITELRKKHKMSKLDIATDSLTLLAKKKEKMPPTLLKPTGSTIEFHKDSKILIRKSIESMKLRKSSSAEHETDKFNNLLWKKKTNNIGTQLDFCSAKAVQISHFEVIPPDHKAKVSVVNFFESPVIIDDGKPSVSLSVKSEEIIEPPRASLVGKPREARIVGDTLSKEYMDTQDQFTIKRMNSFIKIFRKNPSLMHLFTEASKN